MVGRMVPLKIPPLIFSPPLIPWTCEYIVSQGKKDFPDMIKVKDFEMGRLSQII